MSYKYVNNTRSMQQIDLEDGTSVWLLSGKKLELKQKPKTVPQGVDVEDTSTKKSDQNKNKEE